MVPVLLYVIKNEQQQQQQQQQNSDYNLAAWYTFNCVQNEGMHVLNCLTVKREQVPTWTLFVNREFVVSTW